MIILSLLFLRSKINKKCERPHFDCEIVVLQFSLLGEILGTFLMKKDNIGLISILCKFVAKRDYIVTGAYFFERNVRINSTHGTLDHAYGSPLA